MRINFEWLSDFVEVPAVAELCEALVAAGELAQRATLSDELVPQRVKHQQASAQHGLVLRQQRLGGETSTDDRVAICRASRLGGHDRHGTRFAPRLGVFVGACG